MGQLVHLCQHHAHSTVTRPRCSAVHARIAMATVRALSSSLHEHGHYNGRACAGVGRPLERGSAKVLALVRVQVVHGAFGLRRGGAQLEAHAAVVHSLEEVLD